MNKIITIAFAIFISVQFVVAQTNETQELLFQLKNSKNDTNKISLRNTIAVSLLTVNPDTCFIICKQTILIAEKILKIGKSELFPFAKKGMAEANRLIGVYNEMKGNLAGSLKHYEIALNLWEQLINEDNKAISKAAKIGKARTLGNIGIVYSVQSDYAVALKYYFQALKINEQINDEKGIARTNGNIGIAFKEQRDYEKAMKYFSKALKMYEKLNYQIGIAHQLGNIAIIYNEQNKFDSALVFDTKVLKIAQELGDLQMQANIIGNIGAIQYFLKNYTDAGTSYKNALKIAEELEDDHSRSINLANIGNLNFELGNFKEAEKFLSEALGLAYKINSLDLIRYQEASIADLYARMEKYDLALTHFKKHISARDSLSSEENHKAQMRTEMNYEFEKKEAILQEQQEKERVVNEEKNRFQKTVISSVIVGLFLVITFALFVLRTLKKTRIQKHIIEEKQKEILDSIYYARRIQRALITNEKYILRVLNKLRINN